MNGVQAQRLWGGLAAVAMLAAPCLAPGAIINDGTTTDGLSLVSNIPYLVPVQTYPSTSTLTVDSGTGSLNLQNGNHFNPWAANAVRAAWVSDQVPADTALTVSADVRTNDSSSADRIGLIILNTTNNKGFIMYVKPGTTMRLATLGLNMAAAADSVVLERSLSGYTSTTFANFSLSVTPNGSNTDVTAVVTQGASVNTFTGSFALGDVMAADAANIRVGYFGYYPAGYEDGFNLGYFDNLSLTPVPEPASMGLAAMGACALLAGRRRREG